MQRLGIVIVCMLLSACTGAAASTSPAIPAPSASPVATRSLTTSPMPSSSASPSPAAALPSPSQRPPSPRETAYPTSWAVTSSLLIPRQGHSATLLRDGRVLVVGGSSGGTSIDEAEVYDPASGTWAAAGSLDAGRTGHTATVLPDGTVLVVGGWSDPDTVQPVASTERFDPREGTWVAGPPLHDARTAHTAALLADGSVMVAGGSTYNGGNGAPIASVEVLRPGAASWITAAPMLEARAAHTATVLPDGDILVVGGIGSGTDETGPMNTTLASAEIWEPSEAVWTATSGLDDGRAKHAATMLLDGTVLVSRMGQQGTAVIYDPSSGTFAPTDDMQHARFGSTSTRLESGEVLVVGGYGPDELETGRSAEVYDPVTASWSPTVAMADARSGHTATRLADGVVLVVGGQNPGGELVDPSEMYFP